MHSVRVMQQHNESIWPHRKADKQAHVTAHLLCDVNMTWNNHIFCSSDKLNACSVSVILTPINKSSFKGIILLHSLWFFTNLLGDAPPPKNFYKWHFSFVLTGSDKPTSEWDSMTSSDYGSRNHRRQEMGGTRDKQFPGEWLKRSPVSTQDIIDCHLTRTKSSRRLSRQPEPGISLSDRLSASTLRVYAAWRLFYLKAPNGIWFVTLFILFHFPAAAWTVTDADTDI